jgi:hypothetical protein
VRVSDFDYQLPDELIANLPTDRRDAARLFVYDRATGIRRHLHVFDLPELLEPGDLLVLNDTRVLPHRLVGQRATGAASHHQGVRTTNLKLLEPWMDALGQGQPATAETETLDPRQRAAEAIWLGLRRRDGVDMDRLDQFLGGPVRNWFAAELDQLAADELIGFAGPSLTLTERGLLFADLVGERILGAALG